MSFIAHSENWKFTSFGTDVVAAPADWSLTKPSNLLWEDGCPDVTMLIPCVNTDGATTGNITIWGVQKVRSPGNKTTYLACQMAATIGACTGGATTGIAGTLIPATFVICDTIATVNPVNHASMAGAMMHGSITSGLQAWTSAADDNAGICIFTGGWWGLTIESAGGSASNLGFLYGGFDRK